MPRMVRAFSTKLFLLQLYCMSICFLLFLVSVEFVIIALLLSGAHITPFCVSYQTPFVSILLLLFFCGDLWCIYSVMICGAFCEKLWSTLWGFVVYFVKNCDLFSAFVVYFPPSFLRRIVSYFFVILWGFAVDFPPLKAWIVCFCGDLLCFSFC